MAGDQPFHSAGEPLIALSDEQKRRLLSKAGYTVFERTSHIGRAWDFRWPGKSPMQSNAYRTEAEAWAAAYVRFNNHLAEARVLIAKVDDFWREENNHV